MDTEEGLETTDEGSVSEVPETQEEGQEEGAGLDSSAEASAQTQQDAQDAVDGAETNAEVKALPAEYDDHVVAIKIDGQEKKMTVGELKRLSSLEQASQRRFEEASEREKKAVNLLQAFRENPEEVFRKLKMNPEEFAEKLLRRRVEEEDMTPAERELAAIKKEREEEQKEINQIKHEKIRAEMDVGFTEAFKKAGLPKQNYLLAKAAHAMRVSMHRANQARQQGIDMKPLNFDEAVDTVKNEFSGGTQAYLNELTPEGIVQFLGDGVVQKLRQHLVSQVRNGTAPSARSGERSFPNGKVPPKKTFQKNKTYSPQEWRDLIDTL